MRKIYALALLLCLTRIGFGQDEAVVCKVTTPPAIDGKADEWQEGWKNDEESKFLYNICLDAENIYIRLKTSDDMNQGKMGRFGFTVWLDPNGKKKRKLGLKYPTPVGRDFEQMGKPPVSGGRSPEEIRLSLKREMIKDTDVLELIGIAKDNIVSSRVGLKNGIQVIIDMDQKGDYIYEAKIPFKAYRLDPTSILVLTVGFETGKLIPQPGQPYSDMSKATSLWVDVRVN